LKAAGGLEKITASDVGVLARKADPLAMRLMADTAEYLSAGIAGLINAFNPEMIIFGGGVIEGNPEIMEQVEKSARNRALSAAVKGLAFVKALLGKDAGVVGAAAFARHKTGGAPSG
jgi:glucokinase